ncbi:hypothetical protein D1BOALGB6SA_1964 [Olavius sp. associated proteobacterium Delta 1]|nr:hypothetical protein D1BOALGB6SA_1964 [Olavius sp. associated proteobacterium Delta 1]
MIPIVNASTILQELFNRANDLDFVIWNLNETKFGNGSI